MHYDVIFQGLDGVEGGELKGVFARSRTGFMNELRSYRAVISSGNHGSVSVWKRDDGQYQCELHRYQVTKAKLIASTKKAVAAWLDEYLPKQHQPEA